MDQCLITQLEDAHEAIWQFYNEHRPHNALGGMTPTEYRNHHARVSILEVSA